MTQPAASARTGRGLIIGGVIAMGGKEVPEALKKLAVTVQHVDKKDGSSVDRAVKNIVDVVVKNQQVN